MSAKSGMMRVGMIGGGSWASRHLQAWQKNPATEVVAIYNRTRARSAKLAAEFSIPDVHDDAESIIARRDVDIISISMPHHMHCALATAAADAGKHVYCEKPLAMTYAEAHQMWSRAKKAGVKTGMQYNPRQDPTIVKLRELVRSGYIGRVNHVELHFAADFTATPRFPMMWRFQKAVAGAGAIGDQGTYIIDQARWMFGEFAAVSGMLHTFIPERPVIGDHYDFFQAIAVAREGKVPADAPMAKVDNEDEAIFLADFASGASGVLKASRVHSDAKTKIYGADGTLWRDARSGKLLARKPGSSETVEIEVPARDPNETIVSQFVRDIQQDTEVGPTFYDGLKNIAVIDAVLLSAQARRWVNVEEVEKTS